MQCTSLLLLLLLLSNLFKSLPYSCIQFYFPPGSWHHTPSSRPSYGSSGPTSNWTTLLHWSMSSKSCFTFPPWCGWCHFSIIPKLKGGLKVSQKLVGIYSKGPPLGNSKSVISLSLLDKAIPVKNPEWKALLFVVVVITSIEFKGPT